MTGTATTPKPAQVFQRGLDYLIAHDMVAYTDLFADDCYVEYAFPPPGWPRELRGSAEVRAQLLEFPDSLQIQLVRDLVVRETDDPEVIVAEFVLAGRVTATDEPYESRYIEVITVRDGQIAQLVDYWNPLVALSVMPQGHGLGFRQ